MRKSRYWIVVDLRFRPILYKRGDEPGEWTPNINAAHRFASEEEAKKHSLKGMTVWSGSRLTA